MVYVARVRGAVVLLALFGAGCGARSELSCALGDCPEGVTFGDGAPHDGGDDGLVDDASVVDGTSEGGLDFDAPGGDDAKPDTLPKTCPLVLPIEGTSCAASLDCSYPGCDPLVADRATCVAGKWHVVASACATTDDRCPAIRPPLGTTCTLGEGRICLYSASCPGGDLAVCRSGKWDGKYGGCAGTERCPKDRPPSGAACGAPMSCTFVNDCGVPYFGDCVDGRWQGSAIASCGTDPSCPAVEPAWGAPCDPLGGYRPCAWKNDCGGFDYGACGWITGKPNAWTIVRGACPKADCPTTPSDGSACSGAASCTYPLGGDCRLDCTCAGGKWSCKQPPCGS